jgi:hypothetical protein
VRQELRCSASLTHRRPQLPSPPTDADVAAFEEKLDGNGRSEAGMMQEPLSRRIRLI